jgi:hypothetical protein
LTQILGRNGENAKRQEAFPLALSVNPFAGQFRSETLSSPRRSQLDSCFVERGILQVKRLRRSPVIVFFAWNTVSDAKLEPKPPPKERRDPLKLARYYRSLMDSGKFESRAALARYLGVSRPRVTQVLRRLE